MKFFDEGKCGAWRCITFSCRDYSEFSYDCQNDLCHVCSSGCFCSSCDNFDDCPDGIDNVEIQERRSQQLQEQQQAGPDNEEFPFA